MEVNQEGDVGVSLYSKKVLILSKANQLLPRWLRFLKGSKKIDLINWLDLFQSLLVFIIKVLSIAKIFHWTYQENSYKIAT